MTGLIGHLALANFRLHRIRAALTIAAITLSVSLVVAVTSGYSSTYAAAHKMLSHYLGSTDAQITRRNDNTSGIGRELIERISGDPAVQRVDGRLEVQGRLLNKQGVPVLESVQVIGIDRPGDRRVETLGIVSGGWFDTADGNVAVIDQIAQERLEVKVGDSFILPGIHGQLTLRVVGVVHKPTILAAASQTVYVPLHTLQKLMLPDNPGQVSRVMIDLKTGADHDAFMSRWREQIAAIDPNLKFRHASDNRKSMDQNLQGLHALSYLGGAVSMLAAMFIVFSALSMGVSERQRSLAMLRAIGALRGQLGRLVVLEGLMLAAVGVLIGVPLGILWVVGLVFIFDFIFVAGVVPSGGGILFATLGALLTALAASILPAWRAMRASPLEAMSPLAEPPRTRGIFTSALAGLLLMSIDPLLLHLPINRSVQFYGHFTIGLAGIMLGFFLLAPLVVCVVERVIGPVVAVMLGLRFPLLRQQLSGGVWRAAGAGTALMVGLAVLVVTQTQGHSALSGWRLPDKFPDMFIFSGMGLTPAEQRKLAAVKGIRPGELLPIAIASPEFGSSIFGIAGAAILPDATMFLGIEPGLAMRMMELEFREGTPAETERLLNLGRHIVVTQEFRQVKGLHVGDKLPLLTNEGVLDFTVAAVVWSPGIDVIASTQDLGMQFDQRTVASIFGSLEDAHRYFGVERVHLFAANLDTGLDKQHMLWRVQETLANKGLKAGDVRQIKYGIQQTLRHLLLLVSTIAYSALAVASLGVTNTIMASIRSRRWQFGILRSIGTTRGQLLRLVLAEAILLGVVGVTLGLLAGIELVIDARQEWGRFVGFTPPVDVPWVTIGIGIAAVMLVSLLASLWPAIHVAKTEPLALLQAGRAAA